VARAPGPSLAYVIGRVDQGVRREMRRRLEPYGLSVPEYTALSILAAVPGLSNAQLARRSLITPPAMLEVLASLERRGLVERHSDPAHARIRRAELTETGMRTLRSSAREIDRLSAQLLEAIPADERDVVRRGLVAVMNRLTSGV
jgi:DNA-binding MarR family transcriptional regulator